MTALLSAKTVNYPTRCSYSLLTLNSISSTVRPSIALTKHQGLVVYLAERVSV